MGAAVLAQLQGQRETIERATGQLQGVNGDLRQADSTLRTMGRRAKWFF